MSERISVYPKEGMKVRTEDGTRHIKTEGERVQPTPYIRRRLNDGDLIMGKTITVDKEPAAEQQPEAKSTKSGKTKSGEGA